MDQDRKLRKPKFTYSQKMAIVAVLVLIAFTLRLVNVVFVETHFRSFLRTFLYIGIFLAWGISVRWRVMQTQVKRFLIVICFLIIFWMVLRTEKFLIIQDLDISRYLWYAYYIPLILIPLFAFYTAISLGKPEDYRIPLSARLLLIPAILMILLVLTNDLHQQVFRFPAGSPVFTDDAYRYGLLWFLIMLWEGGVALTAYFIMLIRCRTLKKKRVLFLTILPFFLAFIYGITSALLIPVVMFFFGDITSAFSLLIIWMLEGCLWSGLIQTNTGYETLFSESSLGWQILDDAGAVVFASKNASPITRASLEILQKDRKYHLDEKTLVRSNPIHGGSVVWKEDVSEIREILREIEENRDNLAEGIRIEQENYEIDLQIHSLREKNRLYDKLHDRISPQTAKMKLLLDELDVLGQSKDADTAFAQRQTLSQIAVLAAYIKRRGNLMFLWEQSEELELQELALCFAESFENLKFLDVECGADFPETQKIPSRDAIRIYEFFEKIIEAADFCPDAIWIKADEKEDHATFRFFAESKTPLAACVKWADDTHYEDGSWVFTLHCGKGA